MRKANGAVTHPRQDFTPSFRIQVAQTIGAASSKNRVHKPQKHQDNSANNQYISVLGNI